MTHNGSVRRICHLEERREWGWGAGDCRAGVFEYHSFGHPEPPVMRTFVGGMPCGPPAWAWTLYLTNTSRRNECAPGSQSLRLVQPVARVLEPRFLLSWLAIGDGPCARVRANPRFFTRWLQSLESEAGAKLEGPLLARREFRACEGTARSQESWLIRQIPAWTRVRMLWAPAPCHRPEAVVAVPGRCSGASRFLLRTPGARAGRSALWTLSPTSPWRTPSSSCQGVAGERGGSGGGQCPQGFFSPGAGRSPNSPECVSESSHPLQE